MANNRFSIKRALRFGWETMKKNFWFFVLIFLIIFAINIIGGYLTDYLQTRGEVELKVFNATSLWGVIIPGIVMQIILWVLGIIMGIGLIKISIKLADGQEARMADLFRHYRLFFGYIFGSFLYFLVVLIGLILLIVPGIIWAIKYQFVLYFIVDKNMGIADSMKSSGQATYGAKGKLFWFGVLISLINLVPTIILMILVFFYNFLGFIALAGFIITIPTVVVATAYIYRKLESSAGGYNHAPAKISP